MALSYERADAAAPLVAAARAEAAWGQRRRLVALAATSLRHREDAEDVASEAISRVLTAEVPIEAIPAWLTTVTRRLVVDEVRKRQRHLRLVTRLGSVLEPASESDVEARLDKAEADWLLGIVDGLPERQRAALLAHAGGHDVAGVAEMLGVSYKSAEHLIGRARAGLRASAKATWAVILGGWGMRSFVRRSAAVTPAAALVMSASLTLLVLEQVESHHAAPNHAQRIIPAIGLDDTGLPIHAAISPVGHVTRAHTIVSHTNPATIPLPAAHLTTPSTSLPSTGGLGNAVSNGVPSSVPADVGHLPGGIDSRTWMCVVNHNCH